MKQQAQAAQMQTKSPCFQYELLGLAWHEWVRQGKQQPDWQLLSWFHHSLAGSASLHLSIPLCLLPHGWIAFQSKEIGKNEGGKKYFTWDFSIGEGCWCATNSFKEGKHWAKDFIQNPIKNTNTTFSMQYRKVCMIHHGVSFWHEWTEVIHDANP